MTDKTVNFGSTFNKGGVPKSRKQILQELLDLENEKVEDVEEQVPAPTSKQEVIKETIDADKNDGPITKDKKPRTQKQLEAFEKAKTIRDANAAKRKEEARIKEEEERKILEEKVVKKAIAIKKKQIKKQAALDDIEDDNTPIQKIKEIAHQPLTKVEPKPKPIINFF